MSNIFSNAVPVPYSRERHLLGAVLPGTVRYPLGTVFVPYLRERHLLDAVLVPYPLVAGQVFLVTGFAGEALAAQTADPRCRRALPKLQRWAPVNLMLKLLVH
jgi:hypothetical protein